MRRYSPAKQKSNNRFNFFLHLIWQHSVMYSSDFRTAVVSVYNSFQSMKRVALLFKISPSTVHRWIKDPRPRSWPKRGSKFTDAMVAMVRLRLHMFPSTTASQLVALIREQLGATVSRQLVALVLKTQLKMSWKRVKKRGCASAKHNRQEQMNTFYQGYASAYANGTLAACDESGFDQRARPVYGYAPRSKPAILVIPPSKIKHVHYSLILAAHMQGNTQSVLHTGSVNGVRFADFVANLPFPRGTTLLMDNASIHKGIAVRQAAEEKGYKLLFTPPYTPEYNPVEMIFGIVKNRFYKERYAPTFSNLDMPECVQSCVNFGTRSTWVSRCFRHVEDDLKASNQYEARETGGPS
jgi:transposase